MPATKLCTIEDVKGTGNINVSFSYDDNGIEQAIRAATSLIKTITRRDWDFGQHVEEQPIPFSAIRGTFRVYPNVLPLWDDPRGPKVFTVSPGRDIVEVNADGFSYSKERGRIDVYQSFLPRDTRDWSLRIDYYGGLKEHDDLADTYAAPADMSQACALQAAFVYDRKVNGNLGVRQRSGKTGAQTFNTLANGLIPEAHSLIAKYVKPYTGN